MFPIPLVLTFLFTTLLSSQLSSENKNKTIFCVLPPKTCITPTRGKP